MPSPLRGFTRAAASPISAQFGPATWETAPPIGSSAEVDARSLALDQRGERGHLILGQIEDEIVGSLRRYAPGDRPVDAGLDRRRHRVVDDPQSHCVGCSDVDPHIPLYRLTDSQHCLEEAYPQDIVVERWTLRRNSRRTCW